MTELVTMIFQVLTLCWMAAFVGSFIGRSLYCGEKMRAIDEVKRDLAYIKFRMGIGRSVKDWSPRGLYPPFSKAAK